MKYKLLFLLPLMGLMMLKTSLAQAKGPPDRVTISSPSLPQEFTLDDQALIGPLGMVMLEDVTNEVEHPFGVEGSARIAKAARQGTYRLPFGAYLITRFYKNWTRYTPFDQVIYFRGDGKRDDIVLYVGIVNGWGPYDGHWYYPTPQGAVAFDEALDRSNPVPNYWRWKME